MSPESMALICTTVGGVITLLITNYTSNRKLKITLEEARLEQARLEQVRLDELKLMREQDRLDRIADREEIMKAGEKRKSEIVKEVNQVKTVAVKSALKSEQALQVSNGFNEKIANTIDIAKETLDKLNNPNA